MEQLTSEQAYALLTLLHWTPFNRLMAEITADVRDEDYAVRVVRDLMAAKPVLAEIYRARRAA